VRSPFVLPVYIVVVFLIFLLCFSLVAMAGELTALSSGGLAGALDVVIGRSPSTVRSCLAVALFPTVLLGALRAARHPLSRPFTLLLPIAAVFCLIYFAPMALRLVEGGGAAGRAPSQGVLRYLRPRVLATGEGAGGGRLVVYAGGVEESSAGASVSDAVIVRASPPDSRLEYYASGTATVQDGGVVLRFPDREVSLRAEPLLLRAAQQSTLTADLLSDLRTLNDELRRAAESSELESIFLCLGLSVFLWGSSFVVRLTRWPALSFSILVILWRGALLAFRFCVETVRPAFAELLGTEAALSTGGALPGLFLLLLGLLCIAGDLLFVRFDFWTREIET